MLKSKREVLALKGFFSSFFFLRRGSRWGLGQREREVIVLVSRYGMVIIRGMAEFDRRNGGIVTY